MSLGIVMIGLNVAANLRRLTEHWRGFPCDGIVYVDSGSRDESVAIARAAGWRVVSLSSEGVISAAAGRYAGTLVCETDWIFYLDGDMVPDLCSVAWQSAYLRSRSDVNVVGTTGDIVDIYAPGDQRVRRQKSREGARAIWFGGAVILKRQAVLDAGNWNPNVHAEEEWDLDARLRQRGGRVLYFQGALAQHQTTRVPVGQVVARLVGLSDFRNPRNGGAGHVIRSALQAGSLWQVISVKPEVFALPLGTLIAIVLLWFAQWLAAASLYALLFVWVSARRGSQFLAVCYLTVPQMIIGCCRYRQRPVKYQVG